MFKQTIYQKIFNIFNILFVTIVGVLCLLPLLNVISVSLSSLAAASTGQVYLWPKGINIIAYKNIFARPAFVQTFLNSVERVVLGATINMLLTIIVAYPLSKNEGKLMGRRYYIWFFVLTMLFSGGLIPWYLTIRATGLLDTIWALILPGAVPVFNVIVLQNFFRAIPASIEEAAMIDGASHWKVLWKIYIPNSLPAIATLTLFCIVFQWNEWFSGLILMSRIERFPLQSYLQVLLTMSMNLQNLSMKEIEELSKINYRTYNAAAIVIATIPVLCVYPFLQKYFVKGLTLGSVKE